MKICLLPDAPGSTSPFDSYDLPADPRPYLADAEWESVELRKATAVGQLLALRPERFDLFFNLCDGAWDEDRPGVEVVRTLERLGAAFTGATSSFYEPSREAMKRVCAAWGVETPGYVLANHERDLERAAETLRFPLILKHPSSYGSVGLTRDSRVNSLAALMEQGHRTIAAFGAALVEEFIEGREATVLVAESPGAPAAPITYTPIEFRFPEGESFKHFDLKWVNYQALGTAPVAEPDLEASLRDASARLFAGLGGTGYGRCDLRIDGDGRPFMLEINPNCGVYYPLSDPGSADLCLLHDPAGHRGFTELIVRAALTRRDRERRAWEVRWSAGGGQGLFATRDLAPGETILRFEAEPHVLVTLDHVERSWDARSREWFDRYAWPLTEDVWVAWSPDPEEWKPVNHSCDPVAWLTGLDVEARRPSRRGEEITLDYGSFMNERMPCFECRCGSPGCRGTVRGDDYLRPFLARYGAHVSDYVRQKRRKLGLETADKPG